MLSLIFAASAIGAWGIAMRRRGFTTLQASGLVALLAFHPSLALHSASVRMYTMVLLETSGAIFILWKIPSTEGRERTGLAIGLSLVLGALVYTIYFGMLFAVGVGALGLIWTLRPNWAGARDRYAGISIILACIGSAILLLPWMPVVFKIGPAERGFGAVLSPTRVAQVWDIMRSFCRTIPGCLFIVLGWIALFLVGKRRLEWSLYAFTLIGIPLAILASLAPRDRIIDARYMVFSLPLLLSAAGSGWITLGERLFANQLLRKLVPVVAFLIPLIPYFTYSRHRYLEHFPDWWYAAKILDQNVASTEERIITGGFLSGEAIVYHLDQIGADPHRFRYKHYVIDMDPFYVHCRSPQFVWYVNVATPPPQYEAILFRYFPYRVTFKGNRAMDAKSDTIQIYCKHPFKLPSDPRSPFPEGYISPYFEPVPLPYEPPMPPAAKSTTEPAEAKPST